MDSITIENYKKYKPGKEVFIKDEYGIFYTAILIGNSLISQNNTFLCALIQADKYGNWGSVIKECKEVYILEGFEHLEK